MKRVLVVIGMVMMLAACKKLEQSYTFRVKNNTAEDMSLAFKLDDAVGGFHSDTTYTYLIAAGQTKDVFIHLQPSNESEIKNIFPVPEPIYSNFIVTKSGQTANTDFLQQGEWIFNKKNDYTGIYELVVDTTDF